MFDTLSIKCRFRWPSFGDSQVVGGLFGFAGQGAVGSICFYQPGTDGSSGSVSLYFGSPIPHYYTLPSLPVSGSDDEVELRVVPNKLSLLYHGEEVASVAVSDFAEMFTDILGRAFTLGVHMDGSSSYYFPGLISSAEITWLSSTDGRISCVTNYYAAENITDSVWRNTADGVVVVAPALQELPIRAVFYDSSTDKFVKLYPDQITEANPNYTPIGVEVIPAEHDVYGTGQAGIMSLAYMNGTTPDVGGSEYAGMEWSSSNTDTSLPNYDKVNLVDGTTYTFGNLPSDRFSGAVSLDGVSKYTTTSRNAPSPYNADGSRNEAYYTTAYSTANALSDFDGRGNTKVLMDFEAEYRPIAAWCCWQFHTPGTDQGQWYLPALGEFGYVINRYGAINETINKVKSVYSSAVVAVMQTSNGYWTSTESASYTACAGSLSGGVYTAYGKSSSNVWVRAFLRL